MNVRELQDLLNAFDPAALVTATDPYLHAECHTAVSTTPWSVVIESTGRIVSEDDVQ